MTGSKSELKTAVFKFAKGKKFITLSLGKPASRFAVVELSKVQGWTGADIAKHLGVKAHPKGKHYEIHLLRKFPEPEDFDLPKPSQHPPVFSILKSPGTSRLGILGEKEKLSRAPRQRPSDEIIGVNPCDVKTIRLYQKSRLLEVLLKRNATLARVIAATRPLKDGKRGYFTELRAIKGKTPRQMEGVGGLLGFKKGALSQGAYVFVLSPKALAPRDFDLKGYTHLPGGNGLDHSGLSEDAIKEKLAGMDYPPGAGILQIDVTRPQPVKLLTKKPLGLDDKL